MQAHYVLCSESAIVDQASGMLSIINITERLAVVGFPFFLPRLVVTGLVEREASEPSTAEARLQVRLGSTVMLDAPFMLEFQDRTRTRAVLTLEGLIFTGPGLVTAGIVAPDGALLGEYSWELTKVGGREGQVELTVSPSG